MGLFGSRKVEKTSKALFYEGNVPDFIADVPCEIFLDDSVMTITQKKSKTTVSLDRSRLLGMDILTGKDFMARFKGNESANSGPKRTFYILNYLSRDNEKSTLVFWLYNIDNGVFKMIGLQNELLKNKTEKTYEL